MAITTPRQIATIPAGGRLLRAVPYSSPILNSFLGSGVGAGGTGELGVAGVFDSAPSYPRDCTRGSGSGPLVLHRARKLIGCERVQNIVRSKPGPPCLENSIAHFFHVRGMM